MDVDEYDDARPRFVFQSRPSPSSSSTLDSSPDFAINKPLIFISLLFLASSFFFFLHSQFLQSLSIWLSLSLLLGPFAPPSLTAGDIRVGLGDVVEFPPENDAIEPDDPKKKPSSKRGRPRRSDPNGSPELVKMSENRGSLDSGSKGKNDGLDSKGLIEEEKEWTEEDLVLLRKQMSKHPVGKPKRWEVISEAFNGRHSVESVINKAKSAGNEKPVDSDSYSKFLKDRKPVDKRVEGGDGEVGSSSSSKEISWSSAEDMALLNALKTFTKDVAMRWEKIAAAVPGKSKAACMKRVSELKKEFRSSKAASEN